VRLIVEKIHNIQYGKDATYARSYFQPWWLFKPKAA
jgi:hypothetical protein